jgi:hypothetical protein
MAAAGGKLPDAKPTDDPQFALWLEATLKKPPEFHA